MDFTIKYMWDADAKVWIATSEEIPGLVLDSDSLEKLLNEVALYVPEMMDINRY